MIVRELLARMGIQVDGSGFQKAESALKGLTIGFAKVQAAALAVKGALLAVVNSTAEQAREIENAARITGLSTDQVQQLGYAAKMSGVSAEELQHGLVHLARSAQEAANGNAEAGAGFFQLGISALDANGKARPLAELLAELSQRFIRMPDGTQKAALAMQVFGRAGAELIPFLDKGPAGIATLSAEARKLGVVMGGSALTAAVRYRDSAQRMMGAVEGLKIAIAERLFAAFTRSAEQLSRWIALHRQWIALGVQKAFETVSQVLHGLVSVGERVFTFFERIWESGSTGKAVLVALGAVVAGLAAPWMSLIGILALVANSFEMYLEGKDSLVGRIIYAFERLGATLGKKWDLFKEDPFGNLRKWSSEFIDWFVDKVNDAVAGAPGKLVAKAVGADPNGATFMDFLSSLIPQEGMNREELINRLYEPSRSAYIGAPRKGHTAADINLPGLLSAAGANAPTILGLSNPAPAPSLMPSPSGGSSSGSGASTVQPAPVTIGELHLHAADLSGGPESFAQQFAAQVGPLIDEHHARVMRETSAAVNR